MDHMISRCQLITKATSKQIQMESSSQSFLKDIKTHFKPAAFSRHTADWVQSSISRNGRNF